MALLTHQSEQVSTAMAEGKSIVVHNTHHLREFRKPLIELAKADGYHTIITFFNIDPNECRRRNSIRPRSGDGYVYLDTGDTNGGRS